MCFDLTDKLIPDTNVDPAVGTSSPYLNTPKPQFLKELSCSDLILTPSRLQ